ncbi:MFS transporter, sucrose transport protein [Pseudohyphozyma bogoriensis]|nr:MFS transporter, sucrose transport protein [Pseudohyphozyma bogoriensis]
MSYLHSIKRNKLYSTLIFLRLFIALTSTSFIHPDEHFQNPEVAAASVFNYGEWCDGPLRTWEWVGSQPCRSIVPVNKSMGAAFELLKFVVGDYPSARTLLLAQRLTMFSLSLVVDLILWIISGSHLTLLLFATSPVLLTFLLRPFTNSLETVLLAAALVILKRDVDGTHKIPAVGLAAIGATIAQGIFTRVTFLAFAAPIVLAVAVLTAQRIPSQYTWLQWSVSMAMHGSCSLAAFLVSAYYFARQDTAFFDLPSLTLTPLNSLLFNISPSNLAAHGTHPRWLHVVVNWPMLFGVGLVGFGAVAKNVWSQGWVKETGEKKDQDRFMVAVYVATFVLPTLLLSLLPHQEPRFLVALIVPLCLLLPQASFFKIESASSRSKRTCFWTAWLIHSTLFTILFGYLHQGGLVPALLKINDALRVPGLPFLAAASLPLKVEFVFWKTFMPPRHLLFPLLPDSARVPRMSVTDLSGAPTIKLLSTLTGLIAPSTEVLLVAPSYAVGVLPEAVRAKCLEQVWGGVGVHVDMDDLPGLFSGGGLSLGGANYRRARWVGRSSILQSWPAAPQWLRYVALTSGMFGIQLVWSCEMAQVSPYLLSLGLSKSLMSMVFIAGPLSGLIVQPVVGVLSDGCKSSLGRRRPYIIGGCLTTTAAILLLGWASEAAGVFAATGGKVHARLTISFAILSVYVVDFSVNVIQAMDRSLLVDVVPPSLQPAANAWASRMFGFGAVFGYWIGGVDLVWMTGGWLGNQQLKVITLLTAVCLCGFHAITVVFVTERVLISREDDGDDVPGQGQTKKALKGIWNTFKNLPRPIQQVLNVQFASWIGWFPILFFSTTWVAETYVRVYSGDYDLATAPADVVELATRAGTRALFWHSVTALGTSILVPPFVSPSIPESTSRFNTPVLRSSGTPNAGNSSFLDKALDRLPHLPIPWLSLPLVWTISNGIFATLLISTYLATSVGGASFIIAFTGVCFAVSNWAPFSLLGDLILRLTGPATPVPLENITVHAPWQPPLLSPIPEETAPEHSSLMGAYSNSSTELTEESLSRYQTPPNGGSRENSVSPPTPSTAYFETTNSTPTRGGFIDDADEQLTPTKEVKFSDDDRAKRRSFPYGDFPANNQPLNSEPHLSQLSIHDIGPYSSPNPSYGDITPKILQLQIRHSDSFDLNRDSFSEDSEGEGLGLGALEGERSVPTITVGEASDDWDESDADGEENEGGDQAGVVLGCHNIYIVLPQFLVTALSALIFALFAPQHSVAGAGHALPTNETMIDALPDITRTLLRRAEDSSAGGWDALGMIFRIGGISAAISAVLCWKMTRERDRERTRRIRGTG